jgi:hypothetical protein
MVQDCVKGSPLEVVICLNDRIGLFCSSFLNFSQRIGLPKIPAGHWRVAFSNPILIEMNALQQTGNPKVETTAVMKERLV